jgi:hypothetical protein
MLDCVQSVYTELVEVRDLILRRSIFHRMQISQSLYPRSQETAFRSSFEMTG